VYLFALAALVKSAQPALNLPQLSPFEVLERLMFMGLAIYVGLVLGIFFLKRGLAWLDDRFLITYTGHVPTYGTLGNAFLELQAIAQPEKQYVIEMKEDEKQKKEQDDVAGSNDPNAEAGQQCLQRMKESTASDLSVAEARSGSIAHSFTPPSD
jgi:hypothetical protein